MRQRGQLQTEYGRYLYVSARSGARDLLPWQCLAGFLALRPPSGDKPSHQTSGKVVIDRLQIYSSITVVDYFFFLFRRRVRSQWKQSASWLSCRLLCSNISRCISSPHLLKNCMSISGCLHVKSHRMRTRRHHHMANAGPAWEGNDQRSASEAPPMMPVCQVFVPWSWHTHTSIPSLHQISPLI